MTCAVPNSSTVVDVNNGVNCRGKSRHQLMNAVDTTRTNWARWQHIHVNAKFGMDLGKNAVNGLMTNPRSIKHFSCVTNSTMSFFSDDEDEDVDDDEEAVFLVAAGCGVQRCWRNTSTSKNMSKATGTTNVNATMLDS